MNNILVILFAVLDCNVWGIDQFQSRIDELIRTSRHPRPWLVDLSAGKSIDECLEIVRKAMKEHGILLPEDVGDLLAGFILLRFDNDEISTADARRSLVDVVDAYGTSCVDAEAATRIELRDATYVGIRETAMQTLKYLRGKQLTAVDRGLIEN